MFDIVYFGLRVSEWEMVSEEQGNERAEYL